MWGKPNMGLSSQKAKIESVAKSSPEKHLIVACISRALQDVYEPSLSINSRAWFFDNSTEPFSFVWCMQSLEMEGMIEKVRDMIFSKTAFSFEGKGHYKKKKDRAHWYTQTPDTPLKECNVCHRLLPETSFYMRNQLYRYPMCIECHNNYNREKRAKKRSTFLYGKRLSRQLGQPQPQ